MRTTKLLAQSKALLLGGVVAVMLPLSLTACTGGGGFIIEIPVVLPVTATLTMAPQSPNLDPTGTVFTGPVTLTPVPQINVAAVVPNQKIEVFYTVSKFTGTGISKNPYSNQSPFSNTLVTPYFNLSTISWNLPDNGLTDTYGAGTYGLTP